mmetsp:Transcript_14947/g.16620  ORF Transcript_14947/g.16620 Transcript_14947/m.16620 type:complete len:256 (-) Transcript_14947:1285-2052(-)
MRRCSSSSLSLRAFSSRSNAIFFSISSRSFSRCLFCSARLVNSFQAGFAVVSVAAEGAGSSFGVVCPRIDHDEGFAISTFSGAAALSSIILGASGTDSKGLGGLTSVMTVSSCIAFSCVTPFAVFGSAPPVMGSGLTSTSILSRAGSTFMAVGSVFSVFTLDMVMDGVAAGPPTSVSEADPEDDEEESEESSSEEEDESSPRDFFLWCFRLDLLGAARGWLLGVLLICTEGGCVVGGAGVGSLAEAGRWRAQFLT